VIRQMTEKDLQPLYKGIDVNEFHFNFHAVLWAAMTPVFSCLDPFVLKHKESYPFLYALFECVKR
jgi:hypothetical protein